MRTKLQLKQRYANNSRELLSPVAGIFLLLFTNSCAQQHTKYNGSGPAAQVNVFIGTTQGGNTSPAAHAPFGMISFGPVNLFNATDSYNTVSGYDYPKDSIACFALTHVSGWGCNGALDIPFMPVTGKMDESPVYTPSVYASGFSHRHEKAGPGYYEVLLSGSRINVKAAVSERAAVVSFEYPDTAEEHLVFMPANCANGITGARISVDAKHNRITGYATTGGFCTRNPRVQDYTVYFAAEFNKKIKSSGGWNGTKLLINQTTFSGDSIASYLTFDASDPAPLVMKTAISFVSIRNARLNLRKETENKNIEQLKAETTEKWNTGLSKMKVETADSNMKAMLYTALYHNMLHPNIFDDVNGEYRGFNDFVYVIEKGRHKYVNFSNWDTYRSTAQLQGLLFPKEASDMIHSLYLDAKEGCPAGIPIWGYFNNETWVMNGYSGLPLIANLYAFGGRNIALKKVKDKMVWAADHKYGRGDAYIKYGYVPDYDGPYNYSVSMTLEYATDDYAVSQMCKFAGDSANYHRFLKRSNGVFQLFNDKTGYLQRKTSDGNWVTPFDSASDAGFNEGNAAQYTWDIPHNIPELIRRMGGNRKTVEKLDYFTSRILTKGWNVTAPFYWPSNQPSFLAPVIYNYAGAPEKAQVLIRKSVTSIFRNSPDGLPGNDDLGATSAMFLFQAAGIYPVVPGKPEVTITGTTLNKIEFLLDNGSKITIDTKRDNPENEVIKTIKINGQISNSYFVSLEDVITKRSDLHIELDY